MIQPRPYQQDSIEEINREYAAGNRRLILVLPTGGGKTVTFAMMALDAINAGKRVLVLAHRDRLIQQAIEKISAVVPYSKIGVVKADQNRYHASCVVASAQTISKPSRLALLPKFALVIIDECHRSRADGYIRIIGHVLHKDSLLVGVTATPERGDGKGLGAIYQRIINPVTMLDLIDQGYLSPVVGQRVFIPVDLSTVSTKINRDGQVDYNPEEVVDLMSKTNWAERVTDAWGEFAPGRPTMAFVPGGRDDKNQPAAMAYQLADYMRGQGIRAEAIDGTSHPGRQRRVLDDLRDGRIDVVTNVDLLTEGVDVPPVSCVLISKPCRARGAKLQMIGRGTRVSPGKTNCLVLDLVGATSDLDLLTVGDLYGAPSMRDGEDIRDAVKREKAEAAQRDAEQLTLPDLEHGSLIGQDVDLFAKTEQRGGRFHWIIDKPAKRSTLRAGRAEFTIWKDAGGAYNYSGPSLTGRTADYMIAKDIVEQTAESLSKFGGANAPWCNEPATESQINLLKKNRQSIKPDLTKAEAAGLITAMFAKWKRKGRAA